MLFLLTVSNEVIRKIPAAKNALDNIFESKKLLNTFQEVLVTRQQGHFRSLRSTFGQLLQLALTDLVKLSRLGNTWHLWNA